MTDIGRSPSGRAGRPTDQAPAGLGDTATIPNAMVERIARAIFLVEHPGASWSGGRARAIWFSRAYAALEAARDPTDVMIEAAAATPGMKAASAAMQLHQARGYGFAAGSFDDGSPLHQAWRAMINAALASTSADLEAYHIASGTLTEGGDVEQAPGDSLSSPTEQSEGTPNPDLS